MVTGVQEEVPYCSPGTSSGEQEKARSTSQPQSCSESNPAKIETDQILLAFQQWAKRSNSASFNNNIKKIWEMLFSLTTTIAAFDGKPEKCELCENLFQTKIKSTMSSLKNTNQTSSILSCVVMLSKRSKTSPASIERTWDKSCCVR